MYSVFEVCNGVSETGFGDKTSLTAKIVFTKKEKGRSDSLYLKKEQTMEKKINNILFITGQDGTQMTFKVLFTYHSERFNKDYAVFYNEQDENHLIAYSYDENITLFPITSQEENAELEDALRQYDEEQASHSCD